jgi:hypothetical protein
MITPSPPTEDEKVAMVVCNDNVLFELSEQRNRKWTLLIKGSGRKIRMKDLPINKAHKLLMRAVNIRAEWEKEKNEHMGK